jgi:hypothetical protein
MHPDDPSSLPAAVIDAFRRIRHTNQSAILIRRLPDSARAVRMSRRGKIERFLSRMREISIGTSSFEAFT